MRQFAPDHGENIVLLCGQRIVIVDIANRAVKLDPRREVAHPSVVDAAGVTELEAPDLVRAGEYGLFKLWTKHDRETSNVLLDYGSQFEFEWVIVELGRLVPFEFEVPAKIDGQSALVKKSAAQTILRTGVPVAVAADLGHVEIGGGLDSIGEPVGEFVLVVPDSLAGKGARSGSISALIVPIGHDRVVHLELSHSPLLRRIRVNFELPRVDLRRGKRRIQQRAERQK